MPVKTLNSIRRSLRTPLAAATSPVLALLIAVPLTSAQTPSDLPAAPRTSVQTPSVVPAAPSQNPSAPAQPPAAQMAPTAPAPPTSTAVPPTGQQPAGDNVPPGTEAEAPTIKVEANEVDLVFTVTDKKGHFITGLHQSDFGLLDDGRPPEQVIAFKQQTNLPLRIGIMIDTSSSIRGRFQFEQQSASNFLLQVLHRNDRAFVEGFDVRLDLAQGFTNNIDALNQGVQKLRPGGGTALFDALYSTCKDQMLTLRESGPVRKTIILVSDGDDDYSHALESDAIKECQRADTTVFAISTNVSPTKDKGDDVLNAIAIATGGKAFFPSRFEDVASAFSGIEEELRSQYLLEYRPANFKQDGSYRPIYLQALDPRYKVRAHTGYFAPKAAQ